MHTASSTRRGFLGALGLGAGLALGGCGLTSGDTYRQPDSTVPAEYTGRQRVVAWTTWGSDSGKAMSELGTRFNQSQKDIFVDVQSQNGNYNKLAQKLTTGLRAHVIPDIAVFSEVTWHKFVLNDILEPAENHMSAKDLAVYNQDLLKEGVLGGKTWWIPFARSTPLFFYNPEIFEKAGLPARAPETWTELAEWAGQLQGVQYKSNKPRMMTYPKTDADWKFQGLLWNFGGTISKGLDVTFDHDPVIAAGEYQQRLIKKGHGYMSASANVDFQTGVVAAIEQSTGSLKEMATAAEFEVKAAFVPGEKERAVPTGGGGFSIMAPAAKENKAAAAEFLKFLARPENSAYWTLATGYMPVVDAAKKEPELAEKLKEDPNFSVAVEQLKYSRPEDDLRLFSLNATLDLTDGVERISTTDGAVGPIFRDVADWLRQDAEQIEEQYRRIMA